MKVVLNGFLEYTRQDDGWEDSIRLVDEGKPGEAGWMPLVMTDLLPLAGKQVNITVEVVDGPYPR